MQGALTGEGAHMFEVHVARAGCTKEAWFTKSTRPHLGLWLNFRSQWKKQHLTHGITDQGSGLVCLTLGNVAIVAACVVFVSLRNGEF
jgi:hypothetical protein